MEEVHDVDTFYVALFWNYMFKGTSSKRKGIIPTYMMPSSSIQADWIYTFSWPVLTTKSISYCDCCSYCKFCLTIRPFLQCKDRTKIRFLQIYRQKKPTNCRPLRMSNGTSPSFSSRENTVFNAWNRWFPPLKTLHTTILSIKNIPTRWSRRRE